MRISLLTLRVHSRRASSPSIFLFVYVNQPFVALSPSRTASISNDSALSQQTYPFHELHPTNHHSSQERAIYGASCFHLRFLNPTTLPISNLRSINLIFSLLWAVQFLFLPLLGLCIGHHGLPQHNPLKKKKRRFPVKSC